MRNGLRSWCVAVALIAVWTARAQAQESAGMAQLSAEELAREREARLKEAGVMLDAADIKAIRAVEQARLDMRDTYKKLIEQQKDFTAQGNKKRVADIAADKKQLLLLGRKLDMSPENESAGGNAITYMAKVREFRGQSGKKVREWLDRSSKKVEQYDKEIAKGKAEKGGGAAEGTGAGGGGGGGGGGGAATGSRAVYVNAVSGDVEFFVDGTKIERAQQVIPVGDTFTVRARAMGKKRKALLEMTAPSNTTMDEQTDHRVKYTVDTGSFKGTTDWFVEDETYQWAVTKQPSAHATVEIKDSGKNPAVHKDLATIQHDAAFGYAADVSTSVKWRAISQRPGGNREMTETDTVNGKLDIAVAGR